MPNIAPSTPVSPVTPEQPELDSNNQAESFWDNHLVHMVQFYLTKAVAFILMFQGLRALYSSISFIFIQIPQLEQLLALSQISQTDINELANKAIVMLISTILSLFFALRITVIQSKISHRLNTFIGILLIIGNSQITNFLEKIGSTQLISSVILDGLKSILSF
jgi:hypothetical protein